MRELARVVRAHTVTTSVLFPCMLTFVTRETADALPHLIVVDTEALPPAAFDG